MTPDEIIKTYGLTDKKVNRALYHVRPEKLARYIRAVDAFSNDMSAANFNACQVVERRILREAAWWRRLFRWLDKATIRIYWLGMSETRLHARERSAGLISREPNDF